MEKRIKEIVMFWIFSILIIDFFKLAFYFEKIGNSLTSFILILIIAVLSGVSLLIIINLTENYYTQRNLK